MVWDGEYTYICNLLSVLMVDSRCFFAKSSRLISLRVRIRSGAFNRVDEIVFSGAGDEVERGGKFAGKPNEGKRMCKGMSA